ncbi:MAG: Hsp20/alpha crystallin family protein [Chloroflexi bacterium]|nr:Hsp20/alpha crystallin family protein [Chloroflexota bacterium]
MMRGSSRYSDGLSLRDAVNELMESAFLRPSVPGRAYSATGNNVAMNVFEDDENYHLFFMVPGVKPDSVEITSLNNVLTMTGESGVVQGEDWRPLLREQSLGRFQRQVELPAPFSAESVTATCDHGVLKITVPKAVQQRVHKIKVQKS